MNDKPIPPAAAEFALEQLVAEPVQPYTCAERTQLLAQIERLTMQLTACGVVALANTPESASKVRDMHPDYMSASCGDVIRTVDIQMQLRAELAELKAQPDPWKASGADWCSSIHSNPDAMAWADFFVAVFPGQADKHELMFGWFANAMMAMHDHLKAKPSGVVLPLMAALESVVHDERVPNEVSQEVAAVLIEARRLNSSPVSAGDPEKCSYQDDPRSPAELSLAGCNCVRFGEGNPHWPCKLHTPVSAGVVDERAAFEAWHNQAYGPQDKYNPIRSLAYDSAGVGLGYDDTTVMAQFHAFKGALALSAPSHGEQVREGSLSRESLTLAYRLITKELETLANGSAIDRFKSAQGEFRSAIAAAPSAGSQGGDV